MMVIFYWWLAFVVWMLSLLVALRHGYKMGKAREEAGRLLFVYLGPTEFTVAGNIIRLASGDLFEARMWTRDQHNIHKRSVGDD